MNLKYLTPGLLRCKFPQDNVVQYIEQRQDIPPQPEQADKESNNHESVQKAQGLLVDCGQVQIWLFHILTILGSRPAFKRPGKGQSALGNTQASNNQCLQ